MKESAKYKAFRKILFCTGLIMLAEVVMPTAALALTSGPSQPEFSSFEPVATTNMVNDFSGDFTYNLPVLNVPGANGGGYALSLSYHSGGSPEEEASWVGYGWTLNPGSIIRNKRGFPDDYKGAEVKYWNKVPSSKTVSIGAGVSFEAFSWGALSGNASLRYNNYKGIGKTVGVGLTFAKGIVSLGFSVSDGEGSFSARVNPAATLSAASRKGKKVDKGNKFQASLKKKNEKKTAKNDYKATKSKSQFSGMGSTTLIGSNYGIASFGETVRSTSVVRYRGGSYNLAVGVIPAVTPLPLGASVDFTGNYSWQQNVNASNTPGASDNLPAFGYMYASNGAADLNSMMDYYVEKSSSYDKRDKYLCMPFNNADHFMVTGEAIGGGFRLHNKKAGHYHPNEKTSSIQIYNIGVEVEAGLNFGGGGDVGVGNQKLTINNWNNTVATATNFAAISTAATVSSGEDEPVFFRFNNDLGGSVEFGSEQEQRAKISGGGVPGFKSFDPSITHITTTMNSGKRSERSSYIGYNTNDGMEQSANSKKYKAYTLDASVNSFVNRTETDIKEGVGELVVYNEDGMRYAYGLPVYSRNEVNLQYDLQGASAGDINANYLAKKDISNPEDLKTIVGEERAIPYSSMHLLTSITTPDYIDRTHDGVTDDDFGGYTKFNYTRLHGSQVKTGTGTDWYRWRIPYNGLSYNKGELSTSIDDMGAVMAGEKEVYYLESVETKTHIAKFITSDRDDGIEAADNTTAANSFTAKGVKKLKKLDKIELYAKDENGNQGKLLKTTRFEYYDTSGELSKNLPNGVAATTGKLTLKRVWFEYDGVYNARISPYVFEYEYPNAGYPAKYAAFDNYGAGLTQNPNYSFFNLDSWGNFQANGQDRFDSLKTWVNQVPPATFDPAAWQLKVIKLSTGGEIHVQYEQDDYAYVQDKPVLAMTSLKSASDDGNGKYYLKLSDLGISDASQTAEVNEIISKIYLQYILPKKKIYFKFLYNLIGISTPELSSCTSEYISGYSNVKSAGYDVNGLYIELGKPGGLGASKFDLPRKVCRDYLKTQRAGNLNLSGNCDPSVSGIDDANDAEAIVNQIAGVLLNFAMPGDVGICAEMNPGLSYLRLPMIKAKKGGGIRVKRLLMFDEGMEAGDKSLFGSEYLYVTDENGKTISSGVATNEPAAVREENALVDFDPKYKQSFASKVISGRDKEQTEVPLGETILPSPSVGYSKVTIKNIHSGKTKTGITVKEFYTAKDYPVKVKRTTIETKKDYLPLPALLVNYFTNNLWMSQGFTFTSNNMHGQVKSESVYTGKTSDPNTMGLISQQQYTYFTPGDPIPTMGTANSVVYKNLGKEMDVTFEMRGIEDISKDANLEFDIDAGVFGVIVLPFISAFPSVTYTESKLNTHVTTKVISNPAIVKSVLTYADGIYHLSENKVFNAHTGKPVVTKTTDGYNLLSLQQSANHQGAYTSYTFPGSLNYGNLGQKSKNASAIIKSGDSNVQVDKAFASPNYYLDFTPIGNGQVCDLMGKFSSGDLVRITTSAGTYRGLFHVTDSIVGNKLYLKPTALYGTETTTVTGAYIEIVRSGNTNQLSTNVGNTTFYGSAVFTSAEADAWELFAERLDSVRASTLPAALPASLIPSEVYIDNNNSCVSLASVCDSIQIQDWSSISGEYGLVFYAQVLADCSYGVPVGGRFFIDNNTGLLVYGSGACSAEPVNCLGYCSPNNKVIAASAQTYLDEWPYDTTAYGGPWAAGSNKYETGEKNKWRVLSNYVYKENIVGANTGTERNYKDAGTFHYEPFIWTNASLNDTTKWIKTSTVTKYSPNGDALEEKDIMDIYSTAKFGYHQTMPYLVSKNAPFQSVQFESFENKYPGNKLEDGLVASNIGSIRDTTIAHSGRASGKLQNASASPQVMKFYMKGFRLNEQLINKGLSVKFWGRDVEPLPVTVTGALEDSVANAIAFTFNKIARTGEWTLYEATVKNWGSFTSGTKLTPFISAGNLPANAFLWVDDVRIQPLDAQMAAYVYDVRSLRLAAQFDDQHFGLYYQYNAEGKLVRKLVETENGIKTIQETQYNSAKTARQ